MFVTLYFDRESLKVIVPKRELDEQVRKLMNVQEARELLSYFESCDDTVSKSWKTRTRNNHERMISGDPKELCHVVKGLLSLQKKRGQLANSDKQQLRRALDILGEELGATLGKDKEAMIEELESIGHTEMAA